MMPMPKPRPKPDLRPTIARLQYDSTDALRDMHPDLRWVWDELDELRNETDTRTDRLNGLLDAVVNRLTAALELDDPTDEIRETLNAIEDGRADL